MADTKISASTSTGYAANLMIPVAIPSNTGAFHVAASAIVAALTPAQVLTLLASVPWPTSYPGDNTPWLNGGVLQVGP